MMQTDLEFYTRRALEERRAAERAQSSEARQSHHSLADTYIRKAQECAKKPDSYDPARESS
jgi:hypothetical protein